MKRKSTLSHQQSLWLISLVPFVWGMLTATTNLLVPYLQDVYSLTYTQSIWVQVIFSSTPILASLPTAVLIGRVGFKPSLLLALGLSAIGCTMVLMAGNYASYGLTLFAIAVIAVAVTALQVVANPIIAEIGPESGTSQRLTLSSTVNALGVTLAPMLAAGFLFREYEQSTAEQASNLLIPFLALAATIILISIALARLPITYPATPNSPQNQNQTKSRLIKHRHFWFGVLAIFCYTGTEVSTGTYLISYLSHAGGMSFAEASRFIAMYWGGAMLGRLVGTFMFLKVSARKTLIFNALLAAGFTLTAIMLPGRTSGLLLVALGLCHSIMYPVIFSLAVKKLGGDMAKATGILVMAGCGGAVLPFVQALLADSFFIADTFWLTFSCYLVIAFFAIKGYKPKPCKEEALLKEAV
ncbi:glucose/galactose MFS transporter [Photobacterium rosenbergii]|uniref:glucose/galactose MFS transporter n=1 Tax=Photobacterium rosenbergii TaxID=294936 RepID=UPI001C99C128|nr:glucose/galactose MFS transporter [Photobacterium rosenbergii]MBY5946634.1 glucose/galactose MFS transporter [Photobacterium rosenbergii]